MRTMLRSRVRPVSGSSPIAAALLAAGLCTADPSHAVRLNPDGHGQALIYPFYTARSTSNNAFVSLLTVTNAAARPKALKVRILEGRVGAEVLDVNLFLSAYDVWTAAIVQSGAGAGIFTRDNSCTVPEVSRNGLAPTPFRNSAYVGDTYGDSLDRTREGYVEVLEMGAIEPASALGSSVTHVHDFSAPNASKPPCTNLPGADNVPSGLLVPTGGLMGSISLINVTEGTDYSIDATALTRWSDKVQWGGAGSLHPNLSDASPPASVVVADRAEGEVVIRSEWNGGRDAVSAVLMADRIANDYSAEPNLASGTDWVMTMPTRRFHVSGSQFSPPFAGNSVGIPRAEVVGIRYFDREERSPVPPLCLVPGPPCDQLLPYSASVLSWTSRRDDPASATVLGSMNGNRISTTELPSTWINGWAEMGLGDSGPRVLVAAAGKSSVTNTATGTVTTTAVVTYHGLPLVGFAVQAYRNEVLSTPGGNVLSNYGGNFNHRTTRRVESAP